MDSDPAPSSRPGWVRWRIVGLLGVFAVFCHFNRSSMAIAGTEHIIGKLGLNEVQMGSVYTAYLLVYTILMTPGGWLIDRIGPRKALLLMSFGSALFVGLTGVVGGITRSSAGLLWGLLLVRALLGSVTVPMHPGAARMISLWTPPSERSKANGSVNAAALIGLGMTPFLFGYMSDTLGWSTAFLVSGGVSVLPAIAWSLYARDGPREHPAVRFEERALIEREAAPPVATGGRGGSGLLGLLRSRSLILLTLSYAADNYFQYLYVYWIQYYFKDVLHFSQDKARFYSTLNFLAMAVGMISGGWLCDWMQARMGQRRGLARVSILSMVLSGFLLAMGLFGHREAYVVACFALANGVLGICEAAFWTTATQLGKNRGGSAAAIMNTGGNAGGSLVPFLTPLMAQYLGWKGGVGLTCAVSAIGAILWLGIDPGERSSGDPP